MDRHVATHDSFIQHLREMAEAIKFSHSIFAMPFAFIAALLARRGGIPTFREILWITAAMVGARTWAMGINRVVDAKIDALNPRTASRAIPSGRISKQQMLIFSSLGALLLIFAAGALSPLALYCSVPVLLIIASYSYTKRFTFLCHYWLGMSLGLAPLAAWVALRNELSSQIFILSTGICFWVAGFDILYALQDQSFDEETKLFSIPARFGVSKSLTIARVSHAIAACVFVNFGIVFHLGLFYFIGVGLAILLMTYEHWIIRKGNLSKINLAFFNLNGWISVVMLVSTSLALFLGSPK